MSPTLIFLIGAYIGACFGACAMLFWWYRCDARDHGNDQRGTWQ